MTDALGNPLVLGNTYGYAARDGGLVNVGIGVLEKINATKATLRLTDKKCFVYGKMTDEPFNTGNTVSVQGVVLFPVRN